MLGTGIVKGLIETARNFVGSYTDSERLVTVQYPEERLAPKENGRSFPFLVFDGADSHAGLRCVACQICEKECPPKCIYIVKSKDKKPDYVGKAQFYPAIFDIDVSVCMSCQICVEVCPFDAIKMDQEFELSRFDRFEGLLLRKTHLAKSNEYYRELHPTEAGEVDGRLAEEKVKAEAKAKADAEAKAKAAAAPKPVAPAKAAAALAAATVPAPSTPKSPVATPASPVGPAKSELPPVTAPSTQPPGPEAAPAVNAKTTEIPGPAKVNPAPAEASTTNAAQSRVNATPPIAAPQPPPEARP